MKSKEEINKLAKQIANLELAYRKNHNPQLLDELKNLIENIQLEDLDYLDQEIKQILKDKTD